MTALWMCLDPASSLGRRSMRFDSQRTAGMMALSCLLLAYTAYVVPMQLSFWISDDICDPFPTLYSDVLVDSYFMVRFPSDGLQLWLLAL